jgi:hypothetical protein
MKIEIDSVEINEAIKEYVISQGIDVSNMDVLVEFTAGRKKGSSALVTIAPKGTLTETQAIPEKEKDTAPLDAADTSASLDSEAPSLFGNDE